MWVATLLLGFGLGGLCEYFRRERELRRQHTKVGTPSASHNSSSPKCGECGSDTITITCGKCHQVRQFGTWSSPHIGR